MCNKAVDAFLPALKFAPDWLVTNKMIEKLDNSVFSNNGMVFGDTGSGIVIFFSFYIGLNSINLNNLNLDDYNFNNYDPENIIIPISSHKLHLWLDIKDMQHKVCHNIKINKELIA